MMTIYPQGSRKKEESFSAHSSITKISEETILLQISRNTKGRVAYLSRQNILDFLIPEDEDSILVIENTIAGEDGGTTHEFTFSTQNIQDVSIQNIFNESLTDTMVLLITDVKVKKYEF